jgi:hypothetical protein
VLHARFSAACLNVGGPAGVLVLDHAYAPLGKDLG